MTEPVTNENEMDYEEMKDCDFQSTTYESSHKCNKFLLKKEVTERKKIGDDYPDLYPTMNDPNFSLKIAEKREFRDTMYDGDIYDVEERANILSNLESSPYPHQMFVKNFLSSKTPYNSLFLFHGLGTGKTCSAIGVCEEHRDYIKQTNNPKKIIVVASPNVQDNFRLQLFNEDALEKVNGYWKITSCIGNKLIDEINPTNTKNLDRGMVVTQINRLINESYQFMGYREFANFIQKKQSSNINFKTLSVEEQILRMKRNLRLEFDGRLICIDEVHNIRNTEDSENKRVANQITYLVKNTSTLKLLFLSGTPMFNSHKEIVWLVNLMNMNDKRGLIRNSDVFDRDGSFKTASSPNEEDGRELLSRKSTGYFSFVRGENPYVFPYRIYPDIFEKDRTFEEIPTPQKNILGNKVIENSVDTITKTNLYLLDIGSYQNSIYQEFMRNINNDTESTETAPQEDDLENLSTNKKVSYTKLQEPVQSLIISFPKNTEDIKESIGSRGLKSTMNYVDERSDTLHKKGDFEYKPWIQSGEHANFFHPSKIGNYSSKLKNISDSIKKSKGVILIYSQYLDGGLIPAALMLEEMGIKKYGSKSDSLFKNSPQTPVDYKTLEPITASSDVKSPAKYIMITGDKRISKNSINEIIVATRKDNKDGENVKVILVSMAGSEGVDLKFIRQVHILEPWYNMSRIEQIIGRAVRNNSHKALPFSERNVQIFMYGTVMDDRTQESVDVSIYRSAESKAINIGNVTRVLKEISVDCFLNHDQVNFSMESMGQSVKQILSDGKVIEKFEIGDKSFTQLTDFMKDGEYKCQNTKDVEGLENYEKPLDNSSYDEKFILMNNDKIIQKVNSMFKDKFFYTKDDFLSEINFPQPYPKSQVYSALTQMIDSDTEYLKDMYGRTGKLANVGDYYLFQPIELLDSKISFYERTTPIPYKPPEINLQIKHKDFSMKREVSEKAEEAVSSVLTNAQSNLEKEVSFDLKKEVSVERSDENIISIASNISEKYNTALEVFNTTNPDITRGEKNTYKYFGSAMQRLRNTGMISDNTLNFLPSAEILKMFLVEHLVDGLITREKIQLFKHIEDVKQQDVTENKHLSTSIEKYFDKKTMTITNSIGQSMNAIIFYVTTTERVIFTKYEGEDWKIGSPEDVNDLQDSISQIVDEVKPNQIADLFGYIGIGKNFGEVTFKLKDNTNKRSQGSRCHEKKKNIKLDVLKDVIRLAMNISDKPVLEETVNKLKYNGRSASTSSGVFLTPEICVFVEFLCRYYNAIGVNNKRWFFDFEEQNMLNTVLKVV
tara:strand:- start:5507 stop:9376 length:3870 start_codon:yes stop_codon:yes gene_type:complete